MLHMHVTSWILGIILLLVAFFLYKQGNEKGAKIVHMISSLVVICCSMFILRTSKCH